jgi:hypothetical protein
MTEHVRKNPGIEGRIGCAASNVSEWRILKTISEDLAFAAAVQEIG